VCRQRNPRAHGVSRVAPGSVRAGAPSQPRAHCLQRPAKNGARQHRPSPPRAGRTSKGLSRHCTYHMKNGNTLTGSQRQFRAACLVELYTHAACPGHAQITNCFSAALGSSNRTQCIYNAGGSVCARAHVCVSLSVCLSVCLCVAAWGARRRRSYLRCRAPPDDPKALGHHFSSFSVSRYLRRTKFSKSSFFACWMLSKRAENAASSLENANF